MQSQERPSRVKGERRKPVTGLFVTQKCDPRGVMLVTQRCSSYIDGRLHPTININININIKPLSPSKSRILCTFQRSKMPPPYPPLPLSPTLSRKILVPACACTLTLSMGDPRFWSRADLLGTAFFCKYCDIWMARQPAVAELSQQLLPLLVRHVDNCPSGC